MAAIDNGNGVVRYTGNAGLAVDFSKLQWEGTHNGVTAGLKTAPGAADYTTSGTTWHLDGWYDFRNTATVYIKGTQETKPYNGSEQEVTGFEVTDNPNSVPLDSIKLKEGKEAKASGTTVGKYPMGLNGTDFDIPAGYDLVNFIVDDGWLEITPREVTVTGDGWNSDQPYTGSEYSKDTYTFDNVVSGQTASISYSLSGTEVGSYTGKFTDESFKVMSGDTDVTANYKLTTKTPGKLDIVASDIKEYVTLTPVDVVKTYDGTTYTAGTATAVDANGKEVKVQRKRNRLDRRSDNHYSNRGKRQCNGTGKGKYSRFL